MHFLLLHTLIISVYLDHIDAKKQKQRNKGCCFRCDEKGHLSQDCPTKKVAVCAVEAATTELLSKDTHIEEVKE